MSEEYDLRESVKALGKLSPVIKDKYGNVIDGLHRLELYPDWPSVTVDFIDTPEKLEAARLAVNTNRRLVSSSEIAMRVAILAKAGLKADEIATMSGLALRTVYKYFPQDLKEPEKVAAGAVGGFVSAARVHQTVKIPDAVPDLVECERCHVNARDCKPWHEHNLCGKCFERAQSNPGAYEAFFNYRDKGKTHPAAIARDARPRDFDSWQQRKAEMSPQKSALELSVIQDLQAEGYPIETDVDFCVQKTVPDGYVRDANVLIYIDGPVHEGREDRDEQLRERVQNLLNCRIVAVKFERDSKEERERVKTEIKQGLEA